MKSRPAAPAATRRPRYSLPSLSRPSYISPFSPVVYWDLSCYISGDFNRVSVAQVLRSYGALQQVCSVATKKGATLELILTDLHPF